MASASRATRLFGVIGWVVACGLSAAVVIRVWRSDSISILIGVQGVAVWMLMVAYPLAAVAIWKRRIALSITAAALVACQIVLMVGAIGWHGAQPLPADEQAIRLVSANVLYDNQHIRELGDDIAAEEPDVVVLQEVTPEVLTELGRSDLWTMYPYRMTAPEPLFHGAATFSKYPIDDGHSIDVGGSPMLLTDLQTPSGTLRVINVHTVAPLTTQDARSWAGQFPDLAKMVSTSPYPIVLAGDFNATLDHAPLDALVDGDVRDAFQEAGSGFGNTWPEWGGPLPPLMRLDHILVNDEIQVGSVVEEVSIGSDHRRLNVELGLPANARDKLAW
ncbi:endonuclease/exonuclease/phosphatase family protein [Agreia bicolorata]|uniref:Endonuclease/exonuclease/phosphatase domain-containing protein n=1 Tax=Agreia bicolorata TaxID=110935 RepID=A0ABR5CDY4_9MICO|nr:endonuclease/exonuclease/phosphatase family protein [Agreia bicolorata]KJC63838.1 hypothetical protein TZ00_12470 [Agreia bicolorata]